MSEFLTTIALKIAGLIPIAKEKLNALLTIKDGVIEVQSGELHIVISLSNDQKKYYSEHIAPKLLTVVEIEPEGLKKPQIPETPSLEDNTVEL